MDYKVSIIIPIYNAESYLRETLYSIVNQSYKNLEILCVDDGSSDGTLLILEEYSRKDKRIKVLKQENQFAGIARNNGLSHATGDYVMFLDSDDIFEKNMVSYLVKEAVKNDSDIIVFGYWFFVESTKRRRPVKNHYPNQMICSSKDIKDNIFQVTRSLPWDKFLKLDYVRSTGIKYQGTKVNNDIYFNRMIVTQANKIVFLTKRFVNYKIDNEKSLQGKLNINPTDFLIGLNGIHDELCNRGEIDTFRDSFDNMILGDVLAHFRKTKSYSEFVTISNEIIETNFLRNMGIDGNNPQLRKHPYRDLFMCLLSGDINQALYNLYLITRENSIGKESFEYKLGHRLMTIAGITY